MSQFLVAVAFLTRVPVPIAAARADVRAATRWFPAVGAALGTTAALASMALARVEMPPFISAALLVAGGAWITGAIHLDGLADTADGFGGGRTKEDVLRIMRDPCLGSFGAIALIVVLGLKVAALTALIERRLDAGALIAAPALSRWTVLFLARWLPYARAQGGLGEVATGINDVRGFVLATGSAVAVSIAAGGVGAIALWASAFVMAAIVGRSARRRIGGVTGDVFGASVELCETAVLTTAVVLSSRA